MRRTDPVDERIAAKERELARLQEEGAMQLLDARLAKDDLRTVVSFGASLADLLSEIIGRAGQRIEEGVRDVATELNGERRR